MGNPQMNMLQIHNGHHHKQNFKQRMNASNNLHKKKLKSLDIKATTLPKLRLTLKKVYLTPTINNIILTTDNLSVFVVILNVEKVSLQLQLFLKENPQ